MKRSMMLKQKLVYNHPLGQKKLTSDAQRAIGRQPKKRKVKSVGSTKIGTKIRLNAIIPCLLIQVSLKPRPLRKISIMKAAKETI